MTFLFPGILFRKFYFRSAHSKQFDHGNLFERFLWTMLSSIFMLITVTLFFVFIKKTLELPLLDSLSYSTVKGIFDYLSSNQLPPEDEIGETYLDFLTFISALYLLSILFGMLGYLINAKILYLFKYNNYWENVLKGTYKKKKEKSNIVFGFTQADILIDTNDNSNLYSGRVVDYFLSQQTNDLETIVLSDVFRYKKKYDEKGQKIGTETIKVPGDNFCIGTNRILNLNLTYVYEAKSQNSFYKNLCLGVDVFYGISLLGLLLLLYLNLDWIVFSSIPKKITFFIFSWLVLDNTLRIVKLLINGDYDNLKLDKFIVYLFLIIPYFWLFDLMVWWLIYILEFFALLIAGAVQNSINKKTPPENS